jgi:hypothetical protein
MTIQQTLNDAPQYIKDFVMWVSHIKIYGENKLVNLIKTQQKYFNDNFLYIHFIINSSHSAKVNSEIFKILCNYYHNEDKTKDAIDFFLQYAVIDEEFILTMLENTAIIPDIKSVNALIKRNVDCNFLNKIIEIFILYGLKINKFLLLKLLDVKCYISSIEKYDIEIDEDIYIKCSQNNFYPYELKIVPTDKMLHFELCKLNNYNKIKELKEKGAKFNVCCLEEAINVENNYKVISYLINELKVMPDASCIKRYLIRKTEMDEKNKEFDILFNNYIKNVEQKQEKKEPIKKYLIDKNTTLKIEPLNIKINNEIEYKIKNKIKHFFNYNSDLIKYEDLYKIVLKYLISNKLIIDSYFVINNDLSKLLKINMSSILHIDELNNILTYFISNIDK